MIEHIVKLVLEQSSHTGKELTFNFNINPNLVKGRGMELGWLGEKGVVNAVALEFCNIH